MRMVVQIASSRDEDGTTVLFALCNDGTVWVRYFMATEKTEWTLEPAIPQEPVEDILGEDKS